MNIDSQFSADLSSYDNIIDENTSRVITSLTTGVEVRSLSFDSLKEVTGSLLDMNQEVAKVTLEWKKDIGNNQELFDLVEEYFDSSIQILDFCTVFENCLKRARNSQLIIELAVKQFEEEMYVKTLEELKKFKEAGNPFTKEFFTLFQLVYKQQVSMFHKLQRRKRKLKKKLKSMKTWRMVSKVLFIFAFVSVLIFSVVAAAIAAPPFVTALAGALAVPISSVGKWCDSLWKGYESALKGKKNLISSMEIGTFIKINELAHIRIFVNKLEIEMESLLNNADFALREEDVVKPAIDEIKKKFEVFMETIEVLCERADKCSTDVRRARTVILQKINQISQ
ncbi:hypothetical protein Patl1_28863 [Pistacia atlantica]|uniref:Uncharacterized protein n=1 Tax=Pistacia atlantica TaxID=434234 RepID=A0ACC1BER5_9ROSI|nr:hypothetical protein Patl1_28863 [Pistacia atlantica]